MVQFNTFYINKYLLFAFLPVAFRLYDLRQTGYIEREEVSVSACPGFGDIIGFN